MLFLLRIKILLFLCFFCVSTSSHGLMSMLSSMLRPHQRLTNNIILNQTQGTLTPGVTRCYGEYGCLSIDGRFQSVLRPFNNFPAPPESQNVQFLLYTRGNPDGPQILIPTVEKIRSSYFRVGLPVKILIHGYSANDDLEWIRITKNEFLRLGDFNVILVDWRYRAFLDYFAAVANGRMVGLIVAKLIKILHDAFSVPLETIHLIGHSIGAHVAGHVGEKFNKIGRITGLDPAQPYFENTHPSTHLDPSDALFVDVIHTDSRPIWMTGVGYGPPCGHVDFYPNGGERQAGCKKSVRQHFVDEDYDVERVGFQLFACNHHRSGDYFIESLRSSCPFMAVQCSSYMDFRKGRCFDCGPNGEKCVPLGYYSEQWYHLFGSKMDLPVKMFLMTGMLRPFCRYHFRVTVRTSNNLNRNSAFGRILVKFAGTEGASRIHLNKKVLKFQPASSYMFVIVSKSPEPLREMELIWQPIHQPTHEQVFSNFLGSKTEIEISSIQTEGLEIRSRCKFNVDAVLTSGNPVKCIKADYCENISDEDNKLLRYPLPDSEFPGNSSAVGTLDKGSFVPKPTIIPQPLFKRRNEALASFLDPLVENIFSRTP